MKQFTLPKTERLYLRESISDLFANGRIFTAFPYRVVYRFFPLTPEETTDGPTPTLPEGKQSACAIMAVAPKKRFKHAVDRNHIKRLTREAYRLQKLPLIAAVQKADIALEVAFIYSDNKIITFAETQKAIGKAINKLTRIAASPQP